VLQALVLQQLVAAQLVR
jgi:hypothetical protein